MTNRSINIFFAEYAFYSNEEEKEKAKEYLEYWKNNLIKKLRKDTYEAVLIEENYHERPPEFDGILCQRTTLVLKLCVNIKFKFEVDSLIGIDYGMD